MGPRLAFTISLAAACGLHALILLVPRPAGQIEKGIPTIELALESAPAVGAGSPVAPAPASRAAVPAVVLPTPGPAPARSPGPATPGENGEVSLPAPTGEPAGEPSGANDQATSAGDATGGAAGPAGTEETDSRGTTGTDGRGMDAGAAPVFIPPHPRAEILPTYPRSASRAGFEGIVRIMAYIDESGVLVSAEVLSSSGHDALDKAALQEVRQTLFEPALQAGKTVPCRLVIPVRFKLN